MHPALVDFLCAAPELGSYLLALDRAAAAGDVNARCKLAAIISICEQPDRSLLEIVDAMQRLEHLPEGFVHFSMYQLTGWYPPGTVRVLN
jgi:hypothetical protein